MLLVYCVSFRQLILDLGDFAVQQKGQIWPAEKGNFCVCTVQEFPAKTPARVVSHDRQGNPTKFKSREQQISLLQQYSHFPGTMATC
jgi:hypothetical protein